MAAIGSTRERIYNEIISSIEKWKDTSTIDDEDIPLCDEQRAMMRKVHILQEQALDDFKKTPISSVFCHLFKKVLPILFQFFHEHIDYKKDFDCFGSHKVQLINSFEKLDEIVTCYRGNFLINLVAMSIMAAGNISEEQKDQVAKEAASQMANHPISKKLDLLQDNIKTVIKNVDHYIYLREEIVHLDNLKMMAGHAIDQINLTNLKIRQLENKRKKAKGRKKPKTQEQLQLEKDEKSWEKSIETISKKFEIVLLLQKREEIQNSPKVLQDSFDKTMKYLEELFGKKKEGLL